MNSQNLQNQSHRLLSIDVLRGFDMFFIMGGSAIMIALCNLFPCEFSASIAKQFKHVQWNGFAFQDMIFPLFLFIAGISFPFSYQKSLDNGYTMGKIRLNIIKRGVILILLGIIYNNAIGFDFENMRFYSVLGRIGIAWAIGAMLYTFFSRNVRIAIAVAIPLIYWWILSLGDFTLENNIVAIVDRKIMLGKLIEKNIFDPEGLVSMIPAITTAMFGIFAGEIVRTKDFSEYKKVGTLFVIGAILILLGLVWNNVLPINKKLWTSSYTCFVGGLSYVIFALFYLIIDVFKFRKWTFFFTVIGVNSITVYLAQRIIPFAKVRDFLFAGTVKLMPDDYHKFALAVCYTLTVWLFLYILYRKKIFLKI
ncbi:MAG: DUF5009 domain-containing protein [Verrucomicrobiaceae bacterium]|nr:DUF5009 domain-containing protein [Verrucomicrobiaceae bacterium]